MPLHPYFRLDYVLGASGDFLKSPKHVTIPLFPLHAQRHVPSPFLPFPSCPACCCCCFPCCLGGQGELQSCNPVIQVGSGEKSDSSRGNGHGGSHFPHLLLVGALVGEDPLPMLISAGSAFSYSWIWPGTRSIWQRLTIQ